MSFKVIIFLPKCGYPPFNGESDKEITEAVKKGDFDFPVEEWSVITEEGKDLVRKMLTSKNSSFECESKFN